MSTQPAVAERCIRLSRWGLFMCHLNYRTVLVFPRMWVGVRKFFSQKLYQTPQVTSPQTFEWALPQGMSEHQHHVLPLKWAGFLLLPAKDCKIWAEPSRDQSSKNNFLNIRITRCLPPSAQFYWHLNLFGSSKMVWCCNGEWHKCFTTGTSAGAVHRWLFCHMEQSFIRHLPVRHPHSTWITVRN